MANTVSTKQTKSQILSGLADETGLSKKEVTSVLEALAALAHAHLKKGGSGEFSVPALGVKLRRVIKPAREARKGTNPFTGEEIMIKAKPARNAVKVRPLKGLKEMV
jgi:nucleoid DNA-binding protein